MPKAPCMEDIWVTILTTGYRLHPAQEVTY
jgi:hypothetical protein